MSRRPGLFTQILDNLKNSYFFLKQKDRFIGSDQFGNRYFEREGDKSHNVRASRYIEERKNMDSFDSPEVPVEWNAWLRGMRKDPPTPEEINQNYITMMKTKQRAAELEKKYSGKELPSSSTGSAITQDVKGSEERTPFPTYDDLEISPGEFTDKSTKIK